MVRLIHAGTSPLKISSNIPQPLQKFATPHALGSLSFTDENTIVLLNAKEIKWLNQFELFCLDGQTEKLMDLLDLMDEETLELFLNSEHGQSVNVVHLAFELKRYDVLEALLDAGLALYHFDNIYFNQTELNSQNVSFVSTLIQCGFITLLLSNDYMFDIHDHFDQISSHGFDSVMNPFIQYNKKLLDRAAKTNYKNYIELAKLNPSLLTLPINDDGDTILHFLIRQGDKKNFLRLAKLILDKQAYVEMPNLKSETPLQLAKKMGFNELSKLLQSKTPYPPKNAFYTPLPIKEKLNAMNMRVSYLEYKDLEVIYNGSDFALTLNSEDTFEYWFSKNIITLKVEQDNTLIAYMIYEKTTEPSEMPELKYLCVKREHNSKGLGSILLSLFVENARYDGCHGVTLDSLPSAVNFYMNKHGGGFKLSSELENDDEYSYDELLPKLFKPPTLQTLTMSMPVPYQWYQQRRQHVEPELKLTVENARLVKITESNTLLEKENETHEKFHWALEKKYKNGVKPDVCFYRLRECPKGFKQGDIIDVSVVTAMRSTRSPKVFDVEFVKHQSKIQYQQERREKGREKLAEKVRIWKKNHPTVNKKKRKHGIITRSKSSFEHDVKHTEKLARFEI